MHWCLIILNKEKKTIERYSSTHETTHENEPIHLRNIQDFFEFFCQCKFKIRNLHEPQQLNGYDCGIFVIMYAERLLIGEAPNFIQADVSAHRNTIFNELFETFVEQYLPNLKKST